MLKHDAITKLLCNSSRRRCNHIQLSCLELEGRWVPANWLATAADAGGGPHVIIRTDTNNDGKSDTIASSFFAFDAGFRGGVRVAAGDFNGDGVDELVTAAGPGGGPHIKIWNVTAQGAVTGLRDQFFAYDAGFRGGSWVAAGDLNYDGKDDLFIGAGEGGGPHVKIYSDTNNDGRVSDGLTDSFYAFDPGFRGGVRVAIGEININQLIVAAGPGGGPHVKIYFNSGLPALDLKASNDIFYDYFVYDASYRGGVHVAMADVTFPSDYGELIVSGGPQVKVYNLAYVEGGPPPGKVGFSYSLQATLTSTMEVNTPQFQGGARVVATDFVAGATYQDLAIALGPGGPSRVTIYSGDTGTGEFANAPKDDEFLAFPGFNGGVFVASGNL